MYRGRSLLGLRGRYVYGDVCSGKIWTLRAGRASATDIRLEDDTLERLSSFGEDQAGELYAVSLDGRVLALAPPG